MGRIIGLDYGIKKTGISVTDPLQIIVNPLTVISTDELLAYLIKYAEGEEIEKIVIGEPKHKDGNPVYFEKDIQLFILKLQKHFPEIEIDRQDEDYTSAEAKELIKKLNLKKKKRQDKTLVDKLSSVLILQRYLKHI
ncbi:MAG TPA: Holliday junction resolvase RuvX [Bacteroidetes bacterium]|nr:Holliday junction resolvase RuvX [Bacteroidota bacterium]